MKSGGGLTRGRGMTENVRQQRLYSTQPCVAIHDAITSLAGEHHINTYSACGVWRGKASAWVARHEQMYRLVWFIWSIWWQCPSASFSIQRVRSKWEWWHQVWWNGESCQWDTLTFWECFCQKCNHSRYVGWCTPSVSWSRVKVDKANSVQIDHYILFLRCTTLAQRENEDIAAYVAHGMTAIPTSLFRDFFLRKVDNSELGREIKKNMRNSMSHYANKLTP